MCNDGEVEDDIEQDYDATATVLPPVSHIVQNTSPHDAKVYDIMDFIGNSGNYLHLEYLVECLENYFHCLKHGWCCKYTTASH